VDTIEEDTAGAEVPAFVRADASTAGDLVDCREADAASSGDGETGAAASADVLTLGGD
jgi:hypothetical protein